MPLEDFLARHTVIVMVLLYLTLNWACDHHLLNNRQFVMGVALLTYFGVYLTWTRDGFGLWLLLPCAVATVLAAIAWRARPRPLNGSHEAL